MQPRIDYTKLSPGGYKAMLGLELYLNHSSLEHKLLLMITFARRLQLFPMHVETKSAAVDLRHPKLGGGD